MENNKSAILTYQTWHECLVCWIRTRLFIGVYNKHWLLLLLVRAIFFYRIHSNILSLALFCCYSHSFLVCHTFMIIFPVFGNLGDDAFYMCSDFRDLTLKLTHKNSLIMIIRFAIWRTLNTHLVSLLMVRSRVYLKRKKK